MSKCFKELYIQKLRRVELSVEQKEYNSLSAHYISLQPRYTGNLVPMQGGFQSNDIDTQTPVQSKHHMSKLWPDTENNY